MLITSRENPNIKLYLKLASSRKHRREAGMFVLEGSRLCLDAASENAVFHCVFVTESAQEKLGTQLDVLEEKVGERYFIIPDALAEKLSDTGAPQGVFAIGRMLDKNELSSTICSDGKYIILNNVQDPGNVGTIIRTADAVGISAVILCNSCDVYNPKVIRSTMGSLFRLPVLDECDYDEVLAVLQEKGICSYAAVVDTHALSLTECDFSGGCAVVIGNEGNGLTQSDAQRCDRALTIHMKGNVNSLNAAMAAGIIIWEMLR